jgi:hypothetical protein
MQERLETGQYALRFDAVAGERTEHGSHIKDSYGAYQKIDVSVTSADIISGCVGMFSNMLEPVFPSIKIASTMSAVD